LPPGWKKINRTQKMPEKGKMTAYKSYRKKTISKKIPG
jgi:hypothetical protein